MIRNLISIEDITVDWWNRLYSIGCDIMARPDEYKTACNGKVMASLFFEPSTRTNYSFQSAMMRLGGSLFGFSDPSGTSTIKGEALSDTIRMVAAYSDTIVMRNPREGAAMAASLYSEVPLINAGDGGHMHPTQTLADLTTISSKRGKIGGMTVGLCGDLLNGRTVHSLAIALAKFPNVSFYLISPDELRMPEYMLTFMRTNGIRYTEVTDMEAVIPELDILYMTRVQRERFPSPEAYERLKGVYILTKAKLANAKSDLLIMHPLPRVDEIAYDVDDDPRAVYFEQARFGMFIRMALLLELCHAPRIAPSPVTSNSPHRCTNKACITESEPYLPMLTKGSDSSACLYCDKKILTF